MTGQLPVSEVLMGRSRLGLMDIHNFFNPYVFEERDSAIVTIGSDGSGIGWENQFDLW